MFEVSIKLPGCEPLTGTDGAGVAGDRSTPGSLGVFVWGAVGEAAGRCGSFRPR